MTVIVMAVMLPIVWDIIYPMITTFSVTNETWQVTGTPYQLSKKNLIEDSETVYNKTNPSQTLTKDTDYTINYKKGIINVTASAFLNEWVSADYDWAEPVYVKQGISRTIIPYVFTFLVIGMFVLIAGFVMGRMR